MTKISEEDFLQKCLEFLDYFKVEYKGDIIYGDSGGNSCICNPKSQFAELFGGYSINSISRYVAEKLGKRWIYQSDDYYGVDDEDDIEDEDEGINEG